MPYQPLSSLSNSNWSPSGLFSAAVKNTNSVSTPSSTSGLGMANADFVQPTAPKTMGAPAKTPASNVALPTNTIPANQTAPVKPSTQITQPQSVTPTSSVQPSSTGSAPTTNTNSTTQPQSPANTGLFGQAVGTQFGIAQNGNPQSPSQGTLQGIANTGSQDATQAYGGLYGIATNGSPQFQQASNNVKGLQLTQNEIASNPNLAAEVASGRGQALTGEINAAQTSVQNALAQQAQQITAGNDAGSLANTNTANQISAANDAGNLGLTNQSQQITAANNTGTLTAPQLGQYGQGYYNPLTGQSAGGNSGGALNPINNVQSLAQQVISGQISPSQAYAMGGSVANFPGLLNQAINGINPNFNTGSAQARYDANQSNRTLQGTAPVSAGAQGFGQATQDYNNVKLQVNNVDSLGNLLVQTGSGQNINPFQFAPANQALNTFQSSLSSEGQAQFKSSLAAFAGVASQLLANSSGQIPTDVSNNISKIADGTITMGALQSLVNQAKLEGSTKLGNQASQYIDYQSMLNGGPARNLPGTMSAQGKSYVLGSDGTYTPIN